MRKPQSISLNDLRPGNFVIFPLTDADGTTTEHLGYVLGGSKDKNGQPQLNILPVLTEDQKNPFPSLSTFALDDTEKLKNCGLNAPHDILMLAIQVPIADFQDGQIKRIGYVHENSADARAIENSFRAAAKTSNHKSAFAAVAVGKMGSIPPVARQERHLTTAFERPAPPQKDGLHPVNVGEAVSGPEQEHDGMEVIDLSKGKENEEDEYDLLVDTKENRSTYERGGDDPQP